MSDDFRLALVLDGRAVTALVVGGGNVALRRVRGLLDAGAVVCVRSLAIHPELAKLRGREERLTIEVGEYEPSALDEAMLVVAATDDATLNERIARDARARQRLVTVVDAPDAGNCVTPAVHRAGSLLIAVTAGGVPGAAVRVRDAIAARFDERYAAAVYQLKRLRRHLLESGDRGRWQEAADQLIGDEFCESVEGGTFAERMTTWR